MPTGIREVTKAGLAEWFKAGIAAAGIGRELLKKEFVDQRDYAAITRRAAEIRQWIREALGRWSFPGEPSGRRGQSPSTRDTRRAGFVLANSAKRAHFCAMKISEDIRRHAAEQSLGEDESLRGNANAALRDWRRQFTSGPVSVSSQQ